MNLGYQDWPFPGLHALSLSFQFVCVESLVTAVVDMYPKVFRRGYRRELLILALSIISYFLGLVMLTEVSGVSHALYQTPALRPQPLWLCADPAPPQLLRYLLFCESEHRPSASSGYKVSPVSVLDVAR